MNVLYRYVIQSPISYTMVRDTNQLPYLPFPMTSTAWSVNLIKPLGYFEECLQGLRNLIDLALASPYYDPPRFVFVSSMGMLRSKFSILSYSHILAYEEL